MELRTFRAPTMREALAQVRRELGPEAAILHTREVRARRLFGWLAGPTQIEVTAAVAVNVPSRLPASRPADAKPVFSASRPLAGRGIPAAKCEPDSSGLDLTSYSPRSPQHGSWPTEVQNQLSNLHAMVQELCRRSPRGPHADLPEELFRLFAELIEADLSEEIARELVDRIRREVPRHALGDAMMLRARVARMIEAELAIAGPIAITPGRRRLAALVGPTGVGKTTTIAKLAANFRLREKRQVGLITVDTYRIAAVEQLRTYADIIDLPMRVASTPREMREAVAQMSNLDLILMDTAGRSPKDEVKLQELRAFLNEAEAEEVHLVLSGGASEKTLLQTAERFAAVGTTALILTKLDEAPSLGHVLALLRSSRLPVSYLTNGQNVPDDIETAEAARMAGLILGTETARRK
jgi:flagellar biosynthesis protein FlhF